MEKTLCADEFVSSVAQKLRVVRNCVCSAGLMPLKYHRQVSLPDFIPSLIMFACMDGAAGADL